MSDQSKVDLQKLSQKELLIVTYEKVQDMSVSLASINEKQIALEIRMAIVETKQKMVGALYGGITGAIISGLIALFFSLLK